MTRHSLAHADRTLDAVLSEAAVGPVELLREGQPVAVVLSIADYRRLTGAHQGGFHAALERFRRDQGAEELGLEDALEGVRDRAPGRGVTL